MVGGCVVALAVARITRAGILRQYLNQLVCRIRFTVFILASNNGDRLTSPSSSLMGIQTSSRVIVRVPRALPPKSNRPWPAQDKCAIRLACCLE
jgi:hypothetical protein